MESVYARSNGQESSVSKEPVTMDNSIRSVFFSILSISNSVFFLYFEYRSIVFFYCTYFQIDGICICDIGFQVIHSSPILGYVHFHFRVHSVNCLLSVYMERSRRLMNVFVRRIGRGWNAGSVHCHSN